MEVAGGRRGSHGVWLPLAALLSVGLGAAAAAAIGPHEGHMAWGAALGAVLLVVLLGRGGSGQGDSKPLVRAALSPLDKGGGDAPATGALLAQQQGGRFGAAPPIRAVESRLAWFASALARVHAVSLEAPEPVPLEHAKSEKILAALKAVRSAAARIETSGVVLEPLDDALVGRLLVARDFDAARSASLAQAYVDFRRDSGGFFLPPTNVGSASGAGTFLLPCEDRRGRPVLLVRGKYVDPRTPVPVMRQLFRAYMDAIIAHFLRRRRALDPANPLEQYVCVIDAEGAGWPNVSLGFLQMLVSETNVYYPERLQEVIVLGVNATVRMIWRAASGAVHPRTRKKVKMVAPSDIAVVMRRLVSEERLPADYGGHGSRLGDPVQLGRGVSAKHVGELAAAVWEPEVHARRKSSPSGSTDEDCSSSVSSPGRSTSRRAYTETCTGGLFGRLFRDCVACAHPRETSSRVSAAEAGRGPATGHLEPRKRPAVPHLD